MQWVLVLAASLGLLLYSTRYSYFCDVTLAVDDVESGLVFLARFTDPFSSGLMWCDSCC